MGSGKSSLLAAITAEIGKTEGEVGVACVDQGFGLAAQVNIFINIYFIAAVLSMYPHILYAH